MPANHSAAVRSNDSSHARRVTLTWVAVLAAGVLAGCPSGLSEPEPPAPPADEPLPEGVSLLALPLPEDAADVATQTVGVDEVGTFTFIAFTSATPADFLDPEAPADTNGERDLFLAALDAFGVVSDVVLVTRAALPVGGDCVAADGPSGAPSLAYFANPVPGCAIANGFGTCFLPGCPQGVADPAAYVRVAFESTATDLLPLDFVTGQPQDANGTLRDVFVAGVHVYADQDAVGAPKDGSVDLRVYTALCGYEGLCDFFPTEIVSWSTLGFDVPADGPSFRPSISADGQVVVFESEAANLIPTDQNSARDVFYSPMPRPPCTHSGGYVGVITKCIVCHDCESMPEFRATERVSRPASGVGDPDGGSLAAILSRTAAGEVIAFESDATNLVAGDANAARDVFYAVRRDDELYETFAASVSSGSTQTGAGESSRASLAVLDAQGTAHDVLVAFESEADLDSPKPANTTTNVYLHDSRGNGTTTLLNQRIGPEGAVAGSAQGGSAAADSRRARIAPDGSEVAFETLADNLDAIRPEDSNQASDILVADLAGFFESGHLRHRRASVSSAGEDGDGPSTDASIGSFEAPAGGGPESFALHLAAKFQSERCINCHGFNSVPRPPTFPPNHPPDTGADKCNDCHCPEQTGITQWRAPPAELSFHDKTIEELCAQAQTFPPEFTSALEHLTVDERILWAMGETGVVPCWAPTAGDPCGGLNAKTPLAGGLDEWTSEVTAWVDNGFLCVDFGAEGGDVVTLATQAQNLGAPAGGGTVLAFLTRTKLERASKTSGWAPAGGQQVAGTSGAASITRDDRYVAFETTAAIDPADVNGVSDVYVRDLLLGTTVLVSHAAGSAAAGAGASTNPSAHLDGDGVLHVAFESRAGDLVAGFADGNGADAPDVFWASFEGFDGETDSIVIALASGAGGSATQGAEGASANPSLGGESDLFVAFDSPAGDLLDGFDDQNGAAPDVYRRALGGAPVVELVSRSTAAPERGGDGGSSNPALSADGAFAAFESSASDLAAGFVAGTGGMQVFRCEVGVETLLVSRSTAGAATGGDAPSSNAAISSDGAFVAFQSEASDLLAGFAAGDGASNVFRREFGGADEIVLVSQSTSGATTGGDGDSLRPSIGPDGSEVAFESLATDLAASDSDDALSGIYLFSGASVLRLSQTEAGQNADASAIRPSLGGLGGVVAFESPASNLIGAGVDTNGTADVFRRAR
jgi:Tol biopolymer transport system component